MIRINSVQLLTNFGEVYANKIEFTPGDYDFDKKTLCVYYSLMSDLSDHPISGGFIIVPNLSETKVNSIDWLSDSISDWCIANLGLIKA